MQFKSSILRQVPFFETKLYFCLRHQGLQGYNQGSGDATPFGWEDSDRPAHTRCGARESHGQARSA